MTARLLLNGTWSYDPLPVADGRSIAYLLVDITPEDEPATQAAPAQAPAIPAHGASPLNLSLVLDTSGSMGGAKLRNLKLAVSRVIDNLTPQDSLAITLFDDEVHPLVPSTPVSDPRALHDEIDAIREAGGTAISKGLLVGLDEAIKGRQPGSVSRIVLLTDGQTWGDADRCRELAAQAGAQGIPITALGVGAEEDWSIELLDAIATQSGGIADYIARPEDIARAFEGTLKAMQSTTARNLRLTFNPMGGVVVRSAYRVAPIISRLWPPVEASGEQQAAEAQLQVDGSATAVTLPLGDIESQAGQTLLFELVIPARKPGAYRLAHIMLEYQMTAGSTDVALDLVATLAAGAGKGPGNPRVMNSVEKATTFILQTRALRASMAGDVASATRNLRAAATRLLNMGETDLAHEAERQAELLETKGQMSAPGTKKLAFETRKLAVSEMENTKAATLRLEEERNA